MLETIHGSDDHVIQRPLCWVADLEVAPIDHRTIKAEAGAQFSLPLFRQAGGHHQEEASQTLLSKRCQQQAHFDGLAQANVVRNKPIKIATLKNAPDQVQLVGQWIDVYLRQCPSGSVPVLQGQSQLPQTEPLRKSAWRLDTLLEHGLGIPRRFKVLPR